MFKHDDEIFEEFKKMCSDYDNVLIVGFKHDEGNRFISDFHGGFCDDCLRQALKTIHKNFKIKLKELIEQAGDSDAF